MLFVILKREKEKGSDRPPIPTFFFQCPLLYVTSAKSYFMRVYHLTAKTFF